jgi:hypothetical protein
MTNPTSNFGWQMPTSTDLVTDLPADFEVFGQAVDTDFVDLLGGTTGQVLSKTSATDLDFTWVTANPGDITGVTAGTGISGGGTSGTVTVSIDTAVTADLTTSQTLTNKTLTSPALTTPTISTLTTNGDILYGSGSGAIARLGIGSSAQVLTVAGGIPSWATPAGGSLILISTTTLSAVSSQSFNSVFTSTYRNYQIAINLSGTFAGTSFLGFRFRASSTDTTSLYQSRLQSLNTNTGGSTSFDYNDQIGSRINLGYLKWNTDPQLSGLINVTNPQASQASGVSGIMTGGDYYGIAPVSSLSMAILGDTTAYDGFTLTPSGGGTLTGTVSIYGLAK